METVPFVIRLCRTTIGALPPLVINSPNIKLTRQNSETLPYFIVTLELCPDLYFVSANVSHKIVVNCKVKEL